MTALLVLEVPPDNYFVTHFALKLWATYFAITTEYPPLHAM